MKRFAGLLVAFILVPLFSFAELPDISGLSFDELIELKQQINLALWKSEKWQDVVVPVGAWKIGEDIPAGKWTITVASDDPEATIYVLFCDKLDVSGNDADFSGRFCYYTTIRHIDSSDDSDPYFLDLQCYKGNYIIIKYGSARFTPYTGKPDLGFKK